MTPPGTAISVFDLQDELSRRSGRRVELFLTNNRRRMVSVRRRPDGGVDVRLQRIFLRAPAEVIHELARLVAGGTADKALIRGYVESVLRAVRPDGGAGLDESGFGESAPGLDGTDLDGAGFDEFLPLRGRNAVSAGRSAGAFHDLALYARRLNELYLGGRSAAQVVWGRRGSRRGRHSIRFACYDAERNLVIMNRKLDSPEIPVYFVEYVLFHEMLHEVLGVGERADGKRDIHGRLFKLMEGTYPDFDKARAYEADLCRDLGRL